MIDSVLKKGVKKGRVVSSERKLRVEATLKLFSLFFFFFLGCQRRFIRLIEEFRLMLIRKGRRTELAGSLYHVICSSG